MRVLVTGAAGFIGSHIVTAVREDGHEAVALDAFLPQAHGSPVAGGNRAVDGVVVGDVRDLSLLRTLLADVDAVCHQAAMVGHGLSPSDAPDYVAHNELGTAVLLSAMHEAGVRRLVVASSMVVYGEGAYRCDRHPTVRPGPRARADLEAGLFDPRCPLCGGVLSWRLVGEDAPLDPRSTYAATKVGTEHLASAWARQTGGTVWALRYHNVYGPRMPRDTPYAGVASLFRAALERGEPPLVMEDGAQMRDFVHVRDVAAANVAALRTPLPAEGFEAINVCSGEPHSVLDLAEELCRSFGRLSPRLVGGARPGDVRHVVADPAKARARLGFSARVPFRAGVAEFARAPLRA